MLDGRTGVVSAEEVVDSHLLVLILLVWKIWSAEDHTTEEKGDIHKKISRNANGMHTVFEKATDLLETVRRELAEMVQVVELGVIGADRDDLVILLSLLKTEQRE
jgi:hypothetical protein